MQSAGKVLLDFTTKLGAHLDGSAQAAVSSSVLLNDLSWRGSLALDSSGNMLQLSVVCSGIQTASAVYASVRLLSTSSSGVMDGDAAPPLYVRLDKNNCSVPVALVPVPYLDRKKQYPARCLRIIIEICAEQATNLEQFISNDGLSDVCFDVEGTQLHLHRIILAKASPAFKEMLFGTFIEATEKDRVIPLPDKDLSLFVEFLSTIYPPQLEIHPCRAKNLLPFFQEYQMQHMVDKCELSLCTAPVYTLPPNCTLRSQELEDLLDHLYLCSLYGMDQLHERAMDKLARVPLSQYEDTSEYKSCSPDTRCQLLSARVHLLERLMKEQIAAEAVVMDNGSETGSVET